MVQRLPGIASWVSSLVQVGVLAHSLLAGGAGTAAPVRDATASTVPPGVVLARATQAGLDAQVATAIQHAGLSLAAADPAMARRQLGYVLNCIAGEGLDAAPGHPCAGRGGGIVAAVEAHPRRDDVMLLVRGARALAREGVEAESLGAVRAAAGGVRGLLVALVDLGG
jgi:hypothetical protein